MAYYRCLEGNGGGGSPIQITSNGTVLDYDFWHGLEATKTNFNCVFSDYCLYNSNIVEEVCAYLQTASGYEGFCFKCKDGLNLTVGSNYNLSFDLEVPNGITINPTDYRFGIKHSSSQISNFNTTTDQDFTRQTGTQTVSFTFTAAANNYFSIIVSACTSGSGLLRLRNIKITP